MKPRRLLKTSATKMPIRAEPGPAKAGRGPTDRELRLTAAVYALHGAAKHLRETGRLPEKIGGPWSVIPMRHVIEERGVDFDLTEDEQLIYDAIIREGRLTGGMVRLIDPKAARLRQNESRSGLKCGGKTRRRALMATVGCWLGCALPQPGKA
jgi:hypothetical protein